MMVKAPSIFEWPDVVKVMTLLLDFKFIEKDEESFSFHMRRGSIHFIVKPKYDGTEVHFHEDLGRGLHHKVLEESGNLTKVREELQNAFKEWERLKAGCKPKRKDILAEYFSLDSFCPLHDVCPSFKEDNHLCIYGFEHHKYCEEYVRLKKRIGG